jgi:murein DD-endopeptidase
MMGLKWEKIFENERRQFENMTQAEKFVYFLLLQFNSPYGWGKENPESSDCSGAVCLALYAATGLLVRVTADDLFKKVFTVRNPDRSIIRAAFFVDPLGKAIHVAGLVDDGVILNSQEPGARVRALRDMSAWFERETKAVTVIRGLDRKALLSLSDGGGRFDLDTELNRYMEAVL